MRRLRTFRSLLAAAVLVALLAVACGGGNGDEQPAAELRAVASLEIFADFVRQAGGDRVAVVTLLPSGTDPHTYELPARRVADLTRADLVFMNGLGLEEGIGDVIVSNAGGPVIELAEGLETIGGNPHLWLNARLAARYVERIRDALIEHDPEGRDTYEANTAAYLRELDELDREMEAAIESIPAENRALVTFHDAFPYLAARYGLEIVAVVVTSPGQEPSVRDVAELVEILQSQGVPAVFKEPQFNAAVLELAADDAGVRVLNLLSDAYLDGVDSYIELMRFNLRQLQEGLGGD
ncbi:MAG: zinc ABC transporter substrate-binding protein [Chloroflexi bacterium]|nr:zinc ABC transporter substrate-binding protein [Chloroflexota bacterium]